MIKTQWDNAVIDNSSTAGSGVAIYVNGVKYDIDFDIDGMTDRDIIDTYRRTMCDD